MSTYPRIRQPSLEQALLFVGAEVSMWWGLDYNDWFIACVDDVYDGGLLAGADHAPGRIMVSLLYADDDANDYDWDEVFNAPSGDHSPRVLSLPPAAVAAFCPGLAPNRGKRPRTDLSGGLPSHRVRSRGLGGDLKMLNGAASEGEVPMDDAAPLASDDSASEGGQLPRQRASQQQQPPLSRKRQRKEQSMVHRLDVSQLQQRAESGAPRPEASPRPQQVPRLLLDQVIRGCAAAAVLPFDRLQSWVVQRPTLCSAECRPGSRPQTAPRRTTPASWRTLSCATSSATPTSKWTSG
jgi:hypothetical protein